MRSDYETAVHSAATKNIKERIRRMIEFRGDMLSRIYDCRDSHVSGSRASFPRKISSRHERAYAEFENVQFTEDTFPKICFI